LTSQITLLHLSDPQFGESHRFGTRETFDTLYRRLVDDLQRLENRYELLPDMVIVTGDLTNKGRDREFEEAFHFLERIEQSLKLPRERIVIIPGNHDINRNRCEEYFEECEEFEETPSLPYWKKWQPWEKMFREFYLECPDITFAKEEYWTLFEIEDQRVVIAGLNSTVADSHRKDDHYGYLGEEQLHWFEMKLKNARYDGWLRIGAIHHNPISKNREDKSSLDDRDDFVARLGKHLNVILHGHTHDGKRESLSGIPVLSTGSTGVRINDRPEEVPNQYQILQFTKGHIFLYARHYAPDQKRWIGDTRLSECGDKWIDVIDADFQGVRGLAVHGKLSLPGSRVTFPGLRPEISPYTTMTWSPNFKQLATAHTDGDLHLWEPSTGRKLKTLPSTTEIWSLSFSSDGRFLAHAAADQNIRIWDIESSTGPPKPSLSTECANRIKIVTIFSKNLLAWTEVGDEQIRICDPEIASKEPTKIETGHNGTISAIIFSNTGRQLATGSEDRSIRIWNVETGELEYILEGHADVILSMAASSTGLLASGSKDGTFRVWEFATGRLQHQFKVHNTFGVSTVAFSPGSKYLATEIFRGPINVWDVANRFSEVPLRDRTRVESSIVFSPDELYLASASEYDVQVWNLTLSTMDDA